MVVLFHYLLQISAIILSLTLALSIYNMKNVIHSLLFLMLIYVLTAYLLLNLGFDYIAIVLIQVYIGAVAVLFLFVLMTIETSIIELPLFRIDESFFKKRLFLLGTGVVLILGWSELMRCLLVNSLGLFSNLEHFERINNHENHEFTIHFLGQLIYTYYTIELVIFAFILLVVLIGAVLFFDKKVCQ